MIIFFSVYDFIGFDGWANFFNLELPESRKETFFLAAGTKEWRPVHVYGGTYKLSSFWS